MSPLMLVLSGVPQRPMLGQVLFNDFITGVDSGIECTLSKFAGKTKMCDAVDTPEGWDAIHSVLNNLKEWVHGNLMRCKTAKCKVLHLDCGNPWYEHWLEDELIDSEKWPGSHDLGVGGWEAGHEPPICSCSPESQLNPRAHQKKQDQKVQGGGSAPLLHLFHEESLGKWGLLCLEKRRLWGEFNVAFWYLKEIHKQDGNNHFSRACCDRIKVSNWKGVNFD